MVEVKNAKYEIQRTAKFKKDIKLAKKRGLNIEKLYPIVKLLAKGEALPPEYKDHDLKGDWKNHRECHIQPDWLLIYQIKDNVLVLELSRTGTHSDLFGR